MNNAETKRYSYLTPEIEVLSLVVEQCIASSCMLENMDKNDVYDEEF